MKINSDDDEEQQQSNENSDQRDDECTHQIQSERCQSLGPMYNNISLKVASNPQKKSSSFPPPRLNPRKRGREQFLSSAAAITTTTTTTTPRIFCYEPSQCVPIEGPSRKRQRLSHNHNIKESKEVSNI